MAKAKCEVKIKWKGWNRGGYAEVMNGGGVQAMLTEKANAAAAACNSTFTPKYGESGYSTATIGGSLARGRVVYTDSKHANVSERRHNRLQLAFGGD